MTSDQYKYVSSDTCDEAIHIFNASTYKCIKQNWHGHYHLATGEDIKGRKFRIIWQ